MIIILIILIIILFLITFKNKENMGSMAPNKYLIFIDMEYLAKRNELADELFKFMESNYRTARIFLRGKKIDCILYNTNEANIYYKSRLESVYPRHLKYHFPKTEQQIRKLVKGKSILYLGDKKEMEDRNLENRLLHAEEQLKHYSY